MNDLYFDESLILKGFKAENKEAVIKKMASNLYEKGLVKESYESAVIEREQIFATGLQTNGCSVAIPHTDVVHVNKKSISVAILEEPVEFGIMGEPDATTPVNLVFMLAMDEEHSQLSLLQNLMRIFQNEETLSYLCNENDKSKIKDVLTDQLGFTLKGGE